MKTTRLALLFVAACIALSGCNKVSLAGKYHIEQDGYGFGPGADKLILDLRSDGTFDVKAGPVLLLDGTWEAKSRQITLSKEQGGIVVSYRAEGTKLIPMKDGQDVPGWRWER
jgi:hypothetical protein